MATTSPGTQRTYTILGLVGEGGTGKVYRARMVEGDFTKEVALKMLHDPHPDEALLARFRDEARILALFRDRAVVNVEPPVQLDGRWCVIMDFVEGHTVGQLLRSLGPFPPRVALEIVAEVARVLRNAYTFPGPRGEPLRLLHRDIKPGNIQITPAGEVRVLDFGSARARFAHREAETQDEISGTPGYMAPERLEGIESPAGDIYSLGVTLWCMLTGASTVRLHDDAEAEANRLAGRDPALAAALGLAVQMRATDPDARPSAEEVQNSARTLASALPGETLSEWSERIPPRSLQDDPLKGVTLSEPVEAAPSPSLALTAGIGSMIALVVVGLIGSAAGVLVVVAALQLQRNNDVPDPEAAPAQPAPVPEGMIGVHIRSHPEGATVFVDGEAIGTTPLFNHPVTAGPHRFRMVKGLFDAEERLEIHTPGTVYWDILQGNSALEFRTP